MTYRYLYDGPTLVERLDRGGLYEGEPLVFVRDATPDELSGMDAADALSAATVEVAGARTALTDALALLPSMPLPDPADQAAAQADVDAALTAYRALEGPPADVVDLANKVSTHLQSNAYKRSTEARADYQAGDALFLADPTVTLPQLIAQVRALTAQVGIVRDA